MEKAGVKKKKWGENLSGTQVIALGFLGVILTGTLLLMLPCMNREGVWTPFVDALFMSTTSVCVTGLSLVNIFEYWNFFGQFVILLLIQIGGIGVVAMSVLLMMVFRKKVTLKNRMLIQESYSTTTMRGLVQLTKKILTGIALVEGTGAVLCGMYFVPKYGILRGIWISVFHSISAFCNAGMEVIGEDSLTAFVGNPWINVVTMSLIIIGGIGFFVWWDILRVGKKWGKTGGRSCFLKLHLHSKIVLTTTALLIFVGAALVFLLEYQNPDTLGSLTFFEKIQASLFQSVTTRTAGFYTISQNGLRESTALVCTILMFIGGSPAGTAGGVKTMTLALLFACARGVVKGEKETVLYRRTIPRETVRRALAVFFISISVLLFMTVCISIVEEAPFVTLLYEVTSALATVGLSRNYTSMLNLWGKLIIILCMYIGRIGPISMVIAFRAKGKRKDRLHYAEEDVIVG